MLSAGILVAVVLNRRSTELMTHWRRCAEAAGLKAWTDEWFEFVENELRGAGRAWRAFVEDTARPALRLTAAVLVLNSGAAPERAFAASAVLVDAYRDAMWKRAIDHHLAALVVHEWRRSVAEYRFALRTPMLTAPAILAACDDESCGGLVKCARVLLAARRAVNVPLPDDVAARLDQLARVVPD